MWAIAQGVGYPRLSAFGFIRDWWGIEIAAGDDQTAKVGTAVPVAPKVVVRDALGRALPAVTVAFAVTEGGGTAAPESALTDADGAAAV